MRNHSSKQIILGKLVTRVPAPSQSAKAFTEDVEDLMYECLGDKSGVNTCNEFLTRFTQFATDHNVKPLRMSNKPFGLFFEADGNIYFAHITAKGYSYKKIPRTEYERSTNRLKQ